MMPMDTSLMNTSSENLLDNCSSIMTMRNPTLKIFQLTLFAIIFFFGTVFNSIAFWVFCFKMRKWSETRIFMLNLLFSDCCLLFTIPFRMYSIIYGWKLGASTCCSIHNTYYMNPYTSIAIITLISVDRYICIKFPLISRSLRSPKKAAMACGIVWAFLTSSRIFYEVKEHEKHKSQDCFMKISSTAINISLIFSIMFFFTLLPILTFCSLQIIRILKRKENHSVHEQQIIQKSIYIVSSNFVVFLLCFLPLHILYIIQFMIKYFIFKPDCALIKYISDYVSAAQVIADLNCCFDALCYYFVAKEFWENIKQLPTANKLHLIKQNTEKSEI
ncbi:G-protein coupled receptor 35-like isoform 2-T2 [Discoglossus pictus]